MKYTTLKLINNPFNVSRLPNSLLWHYIRGFDDKVCPTLGYITYIVKLLIIHSDVKSTIIILISLWWRNLPKLIVHTQYGIFDNRVCISNPHYNLTCAQGVVGKNIDRCIYILIVSITHKSARYTQIASSRGCRTHLSCREICNHTLKVLTKSFYYGIAVIILLRVLLLKICLTLDQYDSKHQRSVEA